MSWFRALRDGLALLRNAESNRIPEERPEGERLEGCGSIEAPTPKCHDLNLRSGKMKESRNTIVLAATCRLRFRIDDRPAIIRTRNRAVNTAGIR